MKQEQGGEGGLGKRRHDDDQEDFVDVKRQRFVDPDDGRDRYDKAERYNQGELERVQRIPKKEEEGGDEAKVKVEAPSAEKIREMEIAFNEIKYKKTIEITEMSEKLEREYDSRCERQK